MKILICLSYKSYTSAVYPLIQLTQCLNDKNNIVIFVPKGSRLFEKLSKNFKVLELTLFSLLRTVDKKSIVVTTRSFDTLIATFVSVIKGAKVVRLNFRNSSIFLDKFIKVIPLEKLGWIPEVRIFTKKKGTFKIAIISKLSPERNIESVLKELKYLKTRCKIFVVGRGELMQRLLFLKNVWKLDNVVFIRKKFSKFFRFLSCMDALIYAKAGSDKSMRTILEALSCGVSVFSCEPRARIYIENGKTGIFFMDTSLVDRVLLIPKLMKKIRCNGYRKAGRFWVERRAQTLLREIKCV